MMWSCSTLPLRLLITQDSISYYPTQQRDTRDYSIFDYLIERSTRKRRLFQLRLLETVVSTFFTFLGSCMKLVIHWDCPIPAKLATGIREGGVAIR